MANSPKIGAGFWHSSDGRLPSALESSQRVNSGRTGQLSPAKIETSDGQETLVVDDSYNSRENYRRNIKYFNGL